MSGLSERDVERLADEVAAIILGGGHHTSQGVAAAYASAERIVAKIAERDAVIRAEAKTEALTEALHPEFGYEWREPMPTPDGGMDGGGIAWEAVQQAKAEAWDKGYTSGHSNAMRRMSDEPNAPTTPNPYRRLLDGGDQKPVVLNLDDPYFDGQSLPDALADYEHVHSTTGVCVKNIHGPLCTEAALPDDGGDYQVEGSGT